MIQYLSIRRKKIAIFCCALFLTQLLQPTVTFALTAGPGQPEAQLFQAAGTTEMVDLFSGDFSYNIPLFELPGPNGGYPFNLSYQAGIGMDQEASWVGLGWSLNPGAITRQMRGLPDEFRGDDVITKMSLKPSVTVGLGAGAGVELAGADGVSLKAGLSVSQNNYKGLGYSIDGSLGFARAAGNGMTGGIGLDVSLDSKEGISMQPSLSLSNEIGTVGLSAGYHSKSGLSNVSFFSSINYFDDKDKALKVAKDGDKTIKADGGISTSSSLSLAHPGYTPQITMPMKNLNLSAEFRPGGAWWAVFPNLYIRGFYNEQRLDNDKKAVTTDAYGYLNYQYATSPKALLDFNREKDGIVMKESPNLGIPSLTYDIYSVTGQGISAMYRPMRNDLGMIYDQETSSVSNGGTVGVDVGPAASHVGVHLSVNHSKSTTGAWTEGNAMRNIARFQATQSNDPYEPWYFKVHGEPNPESAQAVSGIAGDNAVRIKLESSSTATGWLENKNLENQQWETFSPNSFTGNRDRKPRNQVIQPITNEQLLGAAGELMPQFKVKYFDQDDIEQVFNRTDFQPHHIAAFTALTAEGLRYNYGIPAYNLKQEEVSFSTQQPNTQLSRVAVVNQGAQGDPKYDYANTDQFLKSVTLPAYTHSHLLTSILGPDYVDLTGDGVSQDDLGYWVKFTYKKTTAPTQPYKWREPFSKAHYQEGWKTDPRDDKGSFTYGEKELWYLAKAETKSHIAVFKMAPRTDGRGVLNKLQDTDLTGESVHKLTEIKLYTRLAGPAAPIKVVRFEHDYSLCKGLYNQAGDGKLTLKKVWFEYGGSTRGSLNPYAFTYSSVNPNYDNNAYDRWGNYKPYPAGDYDRNRDFPYVSQNPADEATIDANASAWSLKEIVLPSGGKIMVDYESDDYGYVQHKQAMQMMEIADPENFNSTAFALKDEVLKVRFKLEKNIPGTLTDPDMQKAEVLKYLDTRREQIYFKLKINLLKSGRNFFEYISGYADINMSAGMGLERPGDSGDFTHGYFHVKAEEGNGKNSHPFSMRAWQHLRTNQPDLTNIKDDKLPVKPLDQTDSQNERVNQIKSMGSIVGQVRQMFGGFYKFCRDNGWGRQVAVGQSWIRLNSLDKVKYGGGLRVRQITMKDQWSEDNEGVYGQVYEYTMVENGQTISSGVAAYEPIIGNDENPLRYAKKYVQSVPLRADNNLFFEYPINETYYPGPQVGYRKVTVWDLASAFLAEKEVKNADNLFPQGTDIRFGTTGKTEHEFFTAKDFPVITTETEKANKASKLNVPVPFLGSLSVSKLATSQGYSIVTNDMHGKPKKISNYRQDKDGTPEPEPISWVQYHYLSKEIVYDQERVNVLLNTLSDNGDQTLSIPASGDNKPKFTLGQETELFTDMRQYEDKTWSGGARINTDIMYIPIVFAVVPIPVPTVWPSIGKTQNLLRMASTNKVIFKSGILQSTDAYDGGSIVTTRNDKWDKLTGAPVVTITNNNFDASVYNYSIPAYSQYAGMGAAYQNIGLTFDMSSVVKDPYKEGLYSFYTSLSQGSLYPGDEVILYEDMENDEAGKALGKAVYMGNIEGDDVIYTRQQLSLKDYKCRIVRSGYRNQLAVSAGTITGLEDPSVKGTPVIYSDTITIVK